jgi:RHS repeat-associated protein
MKTGSTVMRFSYDAGGNVVSVDYSEDNGTNFTTYYYLRNAQGDVVKMIDSSGNTVVEYLYDSWGKPVSTTGSLSSTLGEDQPFRYRGYVYDSDTQLYYLQSRYYDPKICRFISADVLLSTGQGVIGHNSFAYCNNDPICFFDDKGTEPILLTIGGITLTIGEIAFLCLAVLAITAIIISITDSETMAELGRRLSNTIITSVEQVVYAVQSAYQAVREKIAARKHYNTKKKAKEAAKKAGKGKKPIHHPHSDNGPHYHPNVPKGNPHVHDHYYYPKLFILLPEEEKQ